MELGLNVTPLKVFHGVHCGTFPVLNCGNSRDLAIERFANPLIVLNRISLTIVYQFWAKMNTIPHHCRSNNRKPT